MLLQLRDRVISDCVSLLLSEPFLQAARYILRAFCEGVTTARRQEGFECVAFHR